MKKKAKLKEDEAKEKKEKAAKEAEEKEASEKEGEESEAEEKEDEAADDEGHDDADKDKELIKSMLKKHLGGDEHDEETMKAAHEAYQVAKASGMDDEDAQDHVGKGMKMASLMKKHQEAKEAEAKEAKEAEEKKEADAKSEEAEECDVDDKKKEAAAKPSGVELDKLMEQNTKLEARIAGLESEIKRKKLGEYLDKKLKESALPNKSTKAIREKLGELKSEKQIDELIKIYVESFNEAKSEVSQELGFSMFVEKQVTETEGKSEGLNFSDCIVK